MNPDLAAPTSPPAPYGLLGSILWAAAGVAAWLVAQFVLLFAYAAWKGATTPDEMQKLATDATLPVLIASAPVWVGVMVLAARRRGWRARDYLALIPPKRGEILFGIAVLAPLLIASDLISYAAGREVVPAFMQDSYISAKMAGTLTVFFAAVIAAAPLGEEIAFRGFLFRGLSETRLGIAGTLIVTSGIWAAMHVLQYDFIDVAQIFVIGLVLGWLRWASGSTLLTIVLHMLINLGATIETIVKVEWLS
jgi:CAAX protease family protein